MSLTLDLRQATRLIRERIDGCMLGRGSNSRAARSKPVSPSFLECRLSAAYAERIFLLFASPG